MKKLLLLTLLLLTFAPSHAQRPRYDKLSPMLRQMVRSQNNSPTSPTSPTPDPSRGGEGGIYSQGGKAAAELYTPLSNRRGVGGEASAAKLYPPLPPAGGVGGGAAGATVCAFVRIAPDGEAALRSHGCRLLAREGDICIADIPCRNLAQLSLDKRILRIEASHSSHTQLLNDSMAWYLNALPVYEGRNLPQPFMGQDVVVGVMDVGFDLTHPTFYSRDTTTYRISRFWDMLSADTVGSTLYVGRDYAGREELLTVAHARDGLDQHHGTHTAGTATGSGYNSPYQGMAPESDICLVANAVSDDIALIDSADYYKYTYATDALGFKYIFDYAESQGKPCIINFSEGSSQDFWGYDLLYYEMLDRLTGPGRIIVSAAGNRGNDKTWFLKPRGTATAGAFITAYDKTAMITLKSADDYQLRLVAYSDASSDTLVIGSRLVTQQQDSTLYAFIDPTLQLTAEAYPSCYDQHETCLDITILGQYTIGSRPKLSIEVIGSEADVEVYSVTGKLIENASLNPLLTAGEHSHSIVSPASSPGIICVGATYYREGIVNYKGEWLDLGTNKGDYGQRSINTSVGPTYDGRIKPDVMAPGMNVISSYSSYYLENHPDSPTNKWNVATFDFNGRTYAWNTNSGTSMAAPAVAGAIALWLQAKPDLTTEEVMNVFRHTCRHYDPLLSYPNNLYGYGEIDVYRGLLYLLGVEGIEGVSTTHTKAHVTVEGGQLTVDFGHPIEAPVTITLYSLNGTKLMTATAPAMHTTFSHSLPALPNAVYVVQLSSSNGINESTLIKL